MDRKTIANWINSINWTNELEEYIKLKSRSNYPEEVRRCAKYSAKLLEDAGLEAQVYETSGNPIIYAEHISSDNNLTILFYGHYDVQHEGDLSMWETDPFEIVQKDGKLFGRGTADNKGQHFAHILAIRFLYENYPDIFNSINIKFILDGDEERGSFSLPEFFENESTNLKSDLILISDGPSLVYDRPTVVGSVRGILTFQITIEYNNEDLHSGNFGGLARSATNDLIALLATMVDPSGKAKIPKFYEDVVKPTELEKKLLGDLEPVFDQIIEKKKIDPALISSDKSIYFQNQFWPTFNINGIKAGGVGDERRTIIPKKASVSIDCRLVPDMESSKIERLISNFIDEWAKSNNCSHAVEYIFEHAMESVESSLNNPDLEILVKALEEGFNSKPVLVPRLGGSLPIYLFPKYLDQDVFLVPYALPDENNHAPNENLDISFFKNGMISSVLLLEKLSRK